MLKLPVPVLNLFFKSPLSLLCWQAFSCRGDISQEKKQKRFYQEDQGKQAKYRTEVDGCRSQTRATHHKSHVGGE